jgi:hypothetical protein
VSNVFSFVASKTGYTNIFIPAAEAPQFNLTAVVPGALSAFSLPPCLIKLDGAQPVHSFIPTASDAFVAFAAPNLTSPRGVLTRPGLDKTLTPARLPPPVNLRALNRTTPWQMSPETTSGGDIVGCADAVCA